MAGVAWAALAGWVLAAALLLLAHRRIEQLQRADTARKWDLLALRAELLEFDYIMLGVADAYARAMMGIEAKN